MLDKEDLTKINNTENTPTSINENALIDNQLLVYPNPSKDKITITLVTNNSVKDGLIEIYTLQGKLLVSTIMNKKDLLIDVSSFIPGAYFVKLTANNEVYKQPFIKN